MRTALRKFVFPLTLLFGALTLFVSCAESLINRPIQMQAIMPTGGHCEYAIRSTTLTTLQSLSRVAGTIGQVVYLNEEVGARPEILEAFSGFQPLDAIFGGGGDSFSPLDFNSLFAVSLYNAAETGYRLYAEADPAANMLTVVPTLSETRIVHRARRIIEVISETEEMTDNAEFFAKQVYNPDGSLQRVNNFLFSFPTKDLKTLPLGLNLGIMVHEYSHLVFQHLFWQRLRAKDRSGEMTYDMDSEAIRAVRAIDEGTADFVGYVASQDPNFFACSYPDSDRDLSKPKFLDSSLSASIQTGTDFGPHQGGAVWASALYRVAKANGASGNLLVMKALARFISSIVTSSSSGTFSFSMGAAAGLFSQAASGVGLNASGMSSYLGGQ